MEPEQEQHEPDQIPEEPSTEPVEDPPMPRPTDVAAEVPIQDRTMVALINRNRTIT
jgi:hypothetical protein